MHVPCVNHQRDAQACLDELPLEAVGQIHLAGFTRDVDAAGAALLIDSHGAPVDDAVWGLFAGVLARLGALPTLIERDNDIPAFDGLMAEARHAEGLMDAGRASCAARLELPS